MMMETHLKRLDNTKILGFGIDGILTDGVCT
jgi:3-deoxy-D-manno-octulosonate 8-phosphate phosphatase KdsC-like HAD superfamily phosphatase